MKVHVPDLKKQLTFKTWIFASLESEWNSLFFLHRSDIWGVLF